MGHGFGAREKLERSRAKKKILVLPAERTKSAPWTQRLNRPPIRTGERIKTQKKGGYPGKGIKRRGSGTMAPAVSVQRSRRACRGEKKEKNSGGQGCRKKEGEKKKSGVKNFFQKRGKKKMGGRETEGNADEAADPRKKSGGVIFPKSGGGKRKVKICTGRGGTKWKPLWLPGK